MSSGLRNGTHMDISIFQRLGVKVRRLATDSRRVQPGDTFLAYPGEKFGCRWPTGPATSMMPASPASAPEIRNVRITSLSALKPANRAARGAARYTLGSRHLR